MALIYNQFLLWWVMHCCLIVTLFMIFSPKERLGCKTCLPICEVFNFKQICKRFIAFCFYRKFDDWEKFHWIELHIVEEYFVLAPFTVVPHIHCMHILDYSAFTSRLGIYYCPLLTVVVVIKLWLTFYMKRVSNWNRSNCFCYVVHSSVLVASISIFCDVSISCFNIFLSNC